MKKGIIFFLSISFIISSCKKDKTGPNIIIEGDNPYTLKIGETFHDPGARAVDPETGDASGNIEYSGNVDINNAGTYEIKYSARDKYRNESIINPIRKVNVVLTSEFLVGYYQFSMTDTGNTITTNYDFSTYIDANTIKFYNYTNLDSVYVNATLSGEYNLNITVPSQAITHNGKNYTVSGTGTLSKDGKIITIDYTQTQNDPLPAITKSGRVIYTRVYL